MNTSPRRGVADPTSEHGERRAVVPIIP